MMIVIAKVKVQPGKEDDFAAAGRKMVAHVKAHEPGTLTYTLNQDRKSTRLNSSHIQKSRMPSSA